MFLQILDPPVLDPSQVLDNNYVLQLPLNQQINLIFFPVKQQLLVLCQRTSTSAKANLPKWDAKFQALQHQ